MNSLEFEKKLAAIEEVEPDGTDIAMIAADNGDLSTVSLDEFKTLMDYSGEISRHTACQSSYLQNPVR